MAARRKHWHLVSLLMTQGAKMSPGVELPCIDVSERRQRRERRGSNYGPPKGLRERRCTDDRRVTFVREVELSAHQWSTYFSQTQPRMLFQPDVHDPASQIFERVRD